MDKPKDKSFLEKWGAQAAALTAILTLIFLLFPHLKPIDHKQAELSSLSSISNDKLSTDTILGVWEQYIFVTQTDLRSGGKFLVAKRDGKFQMSSISQPDDPRTVHSIQISNVESNGSLWKFISNQGTGRLVQFELLRVSENIFEGTAKLGGVVIQHDRWIRVEDEK